MIEPDRELEYSQATNREKPHAKLGIVAFVVAMLSVLGAAFVCVLGAIPYLGNGRPLALGVGIFAWLACITGALSVTGVTLGLITTARRSEENKTLGVIGLVVSAVVLLGFCIIVICAGSMFIFILFNYPLGGY